MRVTWRLVSKQPNEMGVVAILTLQTRDLDKMQLSDPVQGNKSERSELQHLKAALRVGKRT